MAAMYSLGDTALYRRGIQHFDSGLYDAAIKELRIAAFGYVDSIDQFETTQIYIHADLRMKEKALSRVAAPETRPGRYRPDDKLLAFLEAL